MKGSPLLQRKIIAKEYIHTETFQKIFSRTSRSISIVDLIELDTNRPWVKEIQVSLKLRAKFSSNRK
jgi:hypothetical protein